MKPVSRRSLRKSINNKGKRSSTTSAFAGRGELHREDSDDEDDTVKAAKYNPPVDPTQGLYLLPSYLRGGANVRGFDSILGDALSLLFVARHGLKEAELWVMLASLRRQRRSHPKTSPRDNESEVLELKNVIRECCVNKGRLFDLCRSYDPLPRRNQILTSQLFKCVAAICPHLKKEMYLVLIQQISTEHPLIFEEPDEVVKRDGDEDKFVYYEGLVKALVVLEKRDGMSDKRLASEQEFTNI